MRKYILYILILFVFFACKQRVNTADSVPSEFNEKGGEPQLTSYEMNSGRIMADNTESETLTTIAFGSCNKHDLPQPLWAPILQNKPDLWIWLGDNIYGDSEDEAVLRSKYDAQDAIAGYAKLKETTPIIGTWDDHDYGDNDGTKEYPNKEGSKAALLDFLDVAEDAEVRERDGIYQSYTYGTGSKKVKIIILDNRTFRDKVGRDEQKIYIPDPNADILGEEQWEWLESELKNNDATITIIAQGTQIISRFHRYEKWGNYPSARKRLFKMIKEVRPSGVVLLSGDRHHGEFSSVNIPDLKHPLFEFTSSGLTHTRKYPRPEANKFRIGNKVDALNFGVMKINWDASPVKVIFQIRGEENKLYQEHTLEIVK